MASRPTVTILSADGTASGATHPLPKVSIPVGERGERRKERELMGDVILF
jgi:hypothetical protein